MAKLLGSEYKKENILKYTPNLKQIAGVTEAKYETGKGSGMKFYNVKNGSGLEFTLLPDRCMDIASVSYKGINISFLAKNGVVSPEYCYPYSTEFLKYFIGGMLTTSGLLNSGGNCEDTDGTYHPIHGRIGTIPADNPYSLEYWQDNDYVIEAGGAVRECSLFGHNLILKRVIKTKLGDNSIEIFDTVENNAQEDIEFMLLYHFNFGFPFLDEDLKLNFPQNTITPRTQEAKKGIEASEIITKPIDGFLEHVFFRDVKDENGIVTVSLENQKLGIGVKLSYEKENLPVLVQWKSMKSGDYALGIEPSSSFIKGRKEERENKTLKVIRGNSEIKYRLKLSFYDL